MSNWLADDLNAFDLVPGGTRFPGTNPIFTVTPSLPIQLISFTAELQTNSVDCKWEVDNAVNFDHFIVEKSQDGSAFTEAGIIGFSSVRKKYQFIDPSASAIIGPVYYRLKMMDKDATYTYSKTIVIRSTDRNGQFKIVNLAPNPFRDELNVGLYLKENQVMSLRVVDASGRVVRSVQYAARQGFSTKNISELGALKAGIYFLQVEAAGLLISRKLLKK
jgi:hypothetical protein